MGGKDNPPPSVISIVHQHKPEVHGGSLNYKRFGRCTSVISPIFVSLLETWFGILDSPVISSNAGEQGMTMHTARTLRFSSGYSVETFQFVDFFFHAAGLRGPARKAQVHQYLAKSAHFHTKGDDEHIKRLIAESLGGLLTFREFLPQRVTEQLQHVCEDIGLEPIGPRIYPALQEVVSKGDETFLQPYKLVGNQLELIA
jgi:hypothetical protein